MTTLTAAIPATLTLLAADDEESGASAAIAPVVIAVAALAFAILSFWWLNARRGKLRSYAPHSFASSISDSLTMLRLPLIFHNTGAVPIVVLDLRVRFPDEPRDTLGLPWRTTRKRLAPTRDDVEDMGAVFAVPGRSAERRFVEFGAPWPGFAMLGRVFQVRVEARLGHKPDEWSELITFPLQAQGILDPGPYITHSNRPRTLSDDDRAKADAALQDLIDRLDRATNPEGSQE
jgi:hypothetical protein